MKKINILLILLIVIGANIKAQNFNNIIKEFMDTSWRAGGNLKNLNIQDSYKYNKCIDLGDYVYVGERDSHELKQGIIIEIDEKEAFAQKLLPNTVEQKLYTSSNIYGSNGQTIVASATVNYKRKVYIIERSKKGSWEFKQFLKTNEKKIPSEFGGAVAIEGDWIIVSSQSNSTDENGEKLNSAGAVYIFKRVEDKWEQYQKITAKERVKGGNFGLTVDIKNETIIVGSRIQGVIYVFKMDENKKWIQTQELTKPINEGASYTGIIKFINNEIVMLTNGTFKNSGGIYIFKKMANDKWGESQYIQPTDLGDIDCFGGVQKYQVRHISSEKILVTANDDFMFVGVPQQNGEKQNSGAVYVFKKKSDGTWYKIKKIKHENPQFNQHFGKELLVKNNLLFIGYNPYGEASAIRIIKFRE